MIIPDSVTTIDVSAFENCGAVRGCLRIPNSVNEIGFAAFSGNDTFEAFEVESGNTVYCSHDGVLYTIDQKTVVECPTGKEGTISILPTTEVILVGAFGGCSKLTGTLTIPPSVISIEGSAFRGCTGFSGSLIIPDSVTELGYGAFDGCSGFTGDLTITKSITKINEAVFRNCSGFTGELSIPDNITTIGMGAFENCAGFTGGLTIPDSIVTIESYAFEGCSGLTGSLTIPESVTKVGYRAFHNCDNLTGVYFYGDAPEGGPSLFGERGDDFVVHYLEGKSGWTTPEWNGYKTAVFDSTQEISLLTQSEYSVESGKIDGERIIAGVSEKTDCKTFLSNFENTNLVLCNADGETLNEDYAGYIGTGFKLIALDSSGAVIDEVTVIINGEISGDGEVDATDRMILARYLAGWEGYAARILSMDAADIDRNGAVEAADRVILARYLAGWEGYETYFE